jgi:hypothetical protein
VNVIDLALERQDHMVHEAVLHLSAATTTDHISKSMGTVNEGPVVATARLGRRDARADLATAVRSCATRASLLANRFIGPRDRASGLEERGIGRVNRRWRHA